jgi:hypothetical protein
LRQRRNDGDKAHFTVKNGYVESTAQDLDRLNELCEAMLVHLPRPEAKYASALPSTPKPP